MERARNAWSSCPTRTPLGWVIWRSLPPPFCFKSWQTPRQSPHSRNSVRSGWSHPPGVSETLQRFCPYLETLNNIPFLFLVALLLLFLVSVSSTPWLLLGEFLHRSRTPKFFSWGSGSGKPVKDRSQRAHGRKLWDRTTLHVLHILSLKTCSRLWLWNCR